MTISKEKIRQIESAFRSEEVVDGAVIDVVTIYWKPTTRRYRFLFFSWEDTVEKEPLVLRYIRNQTRGEDGFIVFRMSSVVQDLMRSIEQYKGGGTLEQDAEMAIRNLLHTTP